MIIVHHLNQSRSSRIIWLLEELGLKYEIKFYERDPKTKLAPPSLLKVFPLGKSPIITDGDLTLAESGAIIEYILYKYGNDRLRPALGSPEWVQYLYWLHFVEGSFQPMRLLKLIFNTVVHRSPFFIKPITKKIKDNVANLFYEPQIKNQMNLIESTLAKSQWLAGNEFTAADIQLGNSLILSVSQKKLHEWPHILDYIDRIKKRPAYIRTIEVAGPAEFS